MRRFLFFVLACGVLAAPAVSWGASATGSLPIKVTAAASAAACPQGTAYPDGCAAAPAGVPQLANLFTEPFPPHTRPYAVRPPWNVAGVDYHVGCSAPTCAGGDPNGKPLKDPTVSANWPSPSCCTYSAGLLKVTGNNTMLSGFDFCASGVSLQIASGVTGTIITQSKLCAAASASKNGGNIVFVSPSGSASDITFTSNELDGKSPTHSGSGFNVEASFKSYGYGATTVEYNYAHDADNKTYRFEGTYNSASRVTYKYNYSVNTGMYSGTSGDHSEELFNGCDCDFNYRTIAYNTSISNLWGGAAEPTAGKLTLITANYAIGNLQSGVPLTINNDQITNNVIINEGPNSPCCGTAYIAGELTQYGCNNGDACHGNVWANNYEDPTGGYYPYYKFYGITFSNFSGNVNMMTGNQCQANWTDDTGATHTGTCN